MTDSDRIINILTDKNDKTAYEFSKKLIMESSESDKYLSMIPLFSKLLSSESSYIRTRAFMLICCQAKWAANGQIEEVFDKMLLLLNDAKPTVVRQCLDSLHNVILYRPELTEKIKKSIENIDLNIYKDSMIPLIKKDISKLLDLINSMY